MVNLAGNLVRSAAANGAKVAARLDSAEVTYAELDALSSRVAGWLRENGVGPGDRVGLMLPNVLAFPPLYYGVLRMGGVVVPMNPLLKAREVRHYLRDSGAKLAFVWEPFAAEAAEGARDAGAEIIPIASDTLEAMSLWPPDEHVVDRMPSDTAVILYTSGTTGTPKGAELTHSNLIRNVEESQQLFNITADDIVMGCLPLFHAFGQTCGLNTALASGATLTLIERFDPDTVLDVITRDRVTIFQGVPTMYIALLSAGGDARDTSTLRTCVSGGAALPAEVLSSFADRFGAYILEGYGLSETSPVASFNRVDHRRAGSIGHPITGVEMKIVDDTGRDLPPGAVGEIVIRGHNIMKGYWNRPEATADAIRNGWFHSGDMGRVDEDGFFYVVDRKKEMILRGGFNIYPRELEEVLYEHPAVAEAAVIGIPHETHGEEVVAVVALKPGVEAGPEEIRDYMKANVAAYKYPRHVWILDALPKGPTGKILKREIKAPEPAE